MADNPALDPKTAKILPWVVAVAFFMQMLDGTILNTALPTMAKDLQYQSAPDAKRRHRLHADRGAHHSRLGLGWRTNSASNGFSFRHRPCLPQARLACGLSPTLEVIVACRIIQGIGGALMVPVGRLVVLRAYPRATTRHRIELHHHSGPDRASDRTDTGRFSGRIRVMALDFLHQHSRRHHRHSFHHEIHAVSGKGRGTLSFRQNRIHSL